MFVHLSVRSCNCCYKSIEASIVDLPIEEIKLTAFPIPCDCGYFMIGEHYPVSFNKWKLHNDCIQSQINFIQNDIATEKRIDVEMPHTHAHSLIINLEKRLEMLTKRLIKDPIPDHLWKDIL